MHAAGDITNACTLNQRHTRAIPLEPCAAAETPTHDIIVAPPGFRTPESANLKGRQGEEVSASSDSVPLEGFVKGLNVPICDAY